MTDYAARQAAWRESKREREARYDALQLEEDATAHAEGRAPLPVRPGERRRELARRRRLRITESLLSGVSVAQTAEDEGCSQRRLDQILSAWGFALPRRRGCRALGVVHLTGGRAALLDRLAAERGITTVECARRILSAALRGDIRDAKRLLAEAEL
jgi:hypothetical protein